MFARSMFAVVLTSSLFFVAAGAPAASTETPGPGGPSPAAAEHPRDGGIITGKISSVDFRRNVMIVNKTDISLMPSTQIQGSDPGYHAVTDLKPGMSVLVYTSQVAGRYTAQIITLK